MRMKVMISALVMAVRSQVVELISQGATISGNAVAVAGIPLTNAIDRDW